MSWAKSGLAKGYKTDLKMIASADFAHELLIPSRQFIPGSPRMLLVYCQALCHGPLAQEIVQKLPVHCTCC